MTGGDDNQDATVLYEAMKREHYPYGSATASIIKGGFTDGKVEKIGCNV